jgi:hypothetical protein
MNTFKNYLIAILTGLLVLTITAQPSTGASDSAKLVEYERCLAYAQDKLYSDNFRQTLGFCKAYR